ncbi:MAG TPA: hypothetical protein ACFE0H_01700 [Elainellaceae cyanobacterium]|jgi:hypothetical protein
MLHHTTDEWLLDDLDVAANESSKETSDLLFQKYMQSPFSMSWAELDALVKAKRSFMSRLTD